MSVEQAALMAMAGAGNGDGFGELWKVALPDSGPIEQALIAAVTERFLALQGPSRHWHGTLRVAGCRRGLQRLVRGGLA